MEDKVDDVSENMGEELQPDPPEKDEFELEENVWADNDAISPPMDVTPADGEKIIVSSSLVSPDKAKEVTPRDLFGETEPGVLPDIQAKFIKIEDDTTKVIDMKEMMDHIGQSATMDKDKAVSIESLFGNFFDGFNIKELYSTMPSKIGFHRAMRFMKNRISIEEANVVNSANAYVTLAYDNVTALAEKACNEIIPDILTLLRDTQMAGSKLVRQVFDTRDSLDMLDEDNNTIDISYLDVEKPRNFHLSYGNDHVAPLNKAWNAFNQYMKNKELLHFLFKALSDDIDETRGPTHLSLDDNLDGLYINYMSYIAETDLYKIYSYVYSDNFAKSISSLRYIYTDASAVYKTISDKTEPFKIGEDSLDFEKLNNFIVENSEVIRKTNAKINYANKVLSDLPQLFSIMEDLLSHMKYIFK